MTEVTLIKQRVDPERVTQLKDGMEDIRNREKEAIETLRNEGVYTETAFLEETAEGTFLVTYVEAEDLERVWEAFEESTHEIDREFKQVMQDCLEDVQDTGNFAPLYHLANPER